MNALMKLHNLCDDGGDVLIHRFDLDHFMMTGRTPQMFKNDGALRKKGARSERDIADEHSEERKVESTTKYHQSTREAITDHLRRIGATRPPHSRYRANKQYARTVQTARQEIGRAARSRDALSQAVFEARRRAAAAANPADDTPGTRTPAANPVPATVNSGSVTLEYRVSNRRRRMDRVGELISNASPCWCRIACSARSFVSGGRGAAVTSSSVSTSLA